MGVYSILGNHDYADYVQWDSREAKMANLKKLIGHHAELGWQILLDENRILEKDGQKLALIGVQNWSARGGFPKYGDLGKAIRGVENITAKILLSHDPSHWDGEVNSKYPDIGLMLAGHTHGMQFGIDTKVLKWSPVQYVYEQWAGLYQKGSQYLYVNRGFGFIGYPGRLGIWPEITVITLRAEAKPGATAKAEA
jgi:predicted MPP superfamily phosphohydrolase